MNYVFHFILTIKKNTDENIFLKQIYVLSFINLMLSTRLIKFVIERPII